MFAGAGFLLSAVGAHAVEQGIQAGSKESYRAGKTVWSDLLKPKGFSNQDFGVKKAVRGPHHEKPVLKPHPPPPAPVKERERHQSYPMSFLDKWIHPKYTLQRAGDHGGPQWHRAVSGPNLISLGLRGSAGATPHALPGLGRALADPPISNSYWLRLYQAIHGHGPRSKQRILKYYPGGRNPYSKATDFNKVSKAPGTGVHRDAMPRHYARRRRGSYRRKSGGRRTRKTGGGYAYKVASSGLSRARIGTIMRPVFAKTAVFPPKTMQVLVWSAVEKVTSGTQAYSPMSGAFKVFQYDLNSALTPAVTPASSRQAPYFDQMKVIYKNSCVKAVKVTVWFLESDSTKTHKLTIKISPGGDTAPLEDEDAASKSSAALMTMFGGDESGNTTTFSRYINMEKFFGIKHIEDEKDYHELLTTKIPSALRICSIFCWMRNLDQTALATDSMNYRIEIKQYILFTQRKEVKDA